MRPSKWCDQHHQRNVRGHNCTCADQPRCVRHGAEEWGGGLRQRRASPDPSEAAVPEGPHGLWDVIRHMDSFAAARERDVRANRDAPDNINEVVSRVVRSWIDALSRQPSAPERPDPGWFLDDEGNADQLLPALASAYHHSRHVKPSRLPDHSASWRDCSEGMCRRAQAALRAEQVERPSLDVADER